MATFTSDISWETDEWFRTFSESFPQYTQPVQYNGGNNALNIGFTLRPTEFSFFPSW